MKTNYISSKKFSFHFLPEITWCAFLQGSPRPCGWSLASAFRRGQPWDLWIDSWLDGMMRLQMQIGLETYHHLNSQGKPSGEVWYHEPFSSQVLFSDCTGSVYLGEIVLLTCNIVLQKYGSDDCNIGEWRSWWVKLFEASKKLIIFVVFPFGASNMHLNMPYLCLCIIEVK
jgi:hypothetical protein